MALLEAAKRFDPSYGTKLLTYATLAIESAMMDYGSRGSLSLRIPPSRHHQLRKVSHVCAEAENASESVLIHAVCEEKELSERFICEVASLICVHEVFRDTLENEKE